MNRIYPQLTVNTAAFTNNIREVARRCREAGIRTAAVIKGFSAFPPLCRILSENGAAQLATSRLEQMEACIQAGIPGPYLLLRVPMLSELPDVVRLADYSLHSDVTVLKAMNEECRRQGRSRKVILMADLGDLREGFWDKEEFHAAALMVEKELDMLELAGIGTNLGCYGALKPTPEKMQELIDLARRIEKDLGRKLEIVSGGATSSYLLVHRGMMPSGINHLRIGEAIENPLILSELWSIPGLSDYLNPDTFHLKAEIIELRKKPSHPVGEIFIDAFGNTPVFEDRGIRTRALLGVGKADLGMELGITPLLPGIEVVGGSSDHTILDVTDCPEELKTGDVLEFRLDYAAILQLSMRAGLDVSVVYE